MGQHKLNTVLEMFPTLARVVDDLAALPDCCAMPGERCHVLMASPPVQDFCARAVSLCAGPRTKHFTRMGPALDAYWASRHLPILEKDWEGPTDDDDGARSTQQTKCHLAGTCICCETGKKLLKFRGLVLAALKAACPPDSPMRLMQAEGFLVCRLRSKATSKATALIAASFFGEAAEADSSDDERDCDFHYWHLALQLFSPYVAVFQPMLLRAGSTSTVAGDVEVGLEVGPGVRNNLMVDRQRGRDRVPHDLIWWTRVLDFWSCRCA